MAISGYRCRLAIYRAVNDTMGLVQFIARKLRPIAQTGQCSTDSPCLGLLNKIGETGSLFRFCPGGHTTLTILHNRPENHKTFRMFDDLLVTTPLSIPNRCFFLSVTI